MFTNIKAISKILHQGTFSYKKFKTETKLCGQVLKYEYQYEYVAQLPYFKIITYPVIGGIIFSEFILIFLYVYIEHLLDRLQFKKRLYLESFFNIIKYKRTRALYLYMLLYTAYNTFSYRSCI